MMGGGRGGRGRAYARQGGSSGSSERSTFATGVRTVKTVVPYFWPKQQVGLRVRVVLCVLTIVGVKVVNQFVPLLYASAIDGLPGTLPIVPLLLYGLLRWVSSIGKDLRDSIFVKVENFATRSIAIDTFHHVINLSLNFHLSRNTGALMRTMDRGKNAVTTLLSILGFTIAPTILEILLTCGVMFGTFGGWYALITFCSIAGYIAFTLLVTEWRTKFRRALNEKDNETSNAALDSLLNFETLKYFTAENHEVRRYDSALGSYFEVNVKSQLSLALLNIGQSLIITLGLVLALCIAAVDVHNGKLTIGDLVAIQTYIFQLYAPLGWLGTSYRMIINSVTDMEKLFELLEEQPGVADPDIFKELTVQPEGGTVEFKNVTFTYPSRGSKSEPGSSTATPSIHGVSFKIPAGKTVAVVGHSGSGKTTISRLLCRFYDPEEGSIEIDGVDIKHVTQRSLRKKIGVVPQDTVLFNDSIYYNIHYGQVDSDENEINMSVEEAAKEANIHDFIESTPDGYETKVGERGLRLSGGEKQRVAIARTILKNPPILILDEATSALDSQTEQEIQKSLMHVSKGRTTLIIAHRLSTVVNADEIIVLSGGVILEQGTHKQLLERNGHYRSMWELQARQSKEDTSSVSLI